MREIAQATAAMHGATAEVEYERRYPSLHNDAEPHRGLCRGRARRSSAPTTSTSITSPAWAPTISRSCRTACRAAMSGSAPGPAEAGRFLHNPRYDFNDEHPAYRRELLGATGRSRVAAKGFDMSRAAAIARAHAISTTATFLADLRRRVAIPSSSQEPERAAALRAYLEDEIVPSLAPLGFTCRVFDNPRRSAAVPGGRAHRRTRTRHGPGLWPRRHRPRPRRPVARRASRPGRSRSRASASTAAAPPTTRASTRSTSPRIAAVLNERGRLGFNVKLLIEMGEEVRLGRICASCASSTRTAC